MEQAIFYVMNFHGVSREVAMKYYWDEIVAYMEMRERFDLESA